MAAVAPQIICPYLNDAKATNTTATPTTTATPAKGNLNSNDNTAKAFARIFPRGKVGGFYLVPMCKRA